MDDEVKEFIERCEKRAMDILERHRDQLDTVREILLDKEVIEGEEFERLMSEGRGESKPAAETSGDEPAEPAADEPAEPTADESAEPATDEEDEVPAPATRLSS